MNKNFSILVSVAALAMATACAHAAEAIADGLYLAAKGGPAPMLRSPDGTAVYIGERQRLELRAEWFASTNNANTEFSLVIAAPAGAPAPLPTHVLVVSGVAYPNNGGGPSLGFQIAGDANARRISQLLRTAVTMRRHPGHQLRISFTPTRQVFARGEEVTVVMEIANVGANAVAFMQGGFTRGSRDNQYTFLAYQLGRQLPDIGSTNNMGGTMAPREVQPGAAFTQTINLGKWFAFTEPGSYEVHGSYLLRFVEPRGEMLPYLWIDHASADFRITIQ